MEQELYQELILEYSRKKKNRGALGEGASHTHLRNPFCGDDIELWIDFDGDKIRDIRFSGMGCLISQAAASMMAELAHGRTLEEVQTLTRDFKALLHGSEDPSLNERVGDLVALGGVRRVPVRIRCAMLAFEALERLLNDRMKLPADART